MSEKAQFSTLLKEFGQDIGIPEIALDEFGYCCLEIENKHLMNFQYLEHERSLMVFAEIGLVNEEKQLSIYQRLLEANLFWQETNGATIGLAAGDRVVVLVKKCSVVSMTGIELAEFIEEMIATLEYWKNNLTTWNEEEQSEVTVGNKAMSPLSQQGLKV